MGLMAETSTGKSSLVLHAPFTSKAIPVFFEKIFPAETAQILELGPVCNENINLFARRVKKLFVFDVYTRLGGRKRASSRWVDIGLEIDYPPDSFDGITLWDLPDRLDDQDARRLGQQCNRLLKPRGVILVYARGPSQLDKEVNTFVVKEDFTVSFREQPQLNLDINHRKTRDLFGVLDPLIPVQSFIFRNGLREIVLKKGK